MVSGSGVGGGSLGYANTLYVPPAKFFKDPQWADLADWESELAPHYAEAQRMLGVVQVETRRPRRPPPARVRRADRRRRHLPEDPGRDLLRRARQDRPRPLLRRRGTGPHRLHAAAGAAWSAARTAPRTRWSRTTSGWPNSAGSRSIPDRTVTEIRPIGAADGSEGYTIASERSGLLPGRGKRTLRARGVIVAAGAARHQQAAAALPPRRRPAPHLLPPRRAGADQQRDDPRRHRPRGLPRRPDPRVAISGSIYPDAAHPHRDRQLRQGRRLDEPALHAAGRRRHPRHPAAEAARRRSSATPCGFAKVAAGRRAGRGGRSSSW